MSLLDEYNTWKEKLDSAVATVLETDVAETLKTAVSDSVRENVYDEYTPTLYKRREDNGGLSDKRNYFTWAEIDALGYSLNLLNTTTGNEAYANSQGYDSGYITDIIESGNGYHWTSSDIYMEGQPRPFMDFALNEAVTSGKSELALLLGLKKLGF